MALFASSRPHLLKTLFWIIGALLFVFVIVAVSRSPLYRGFAGGQFLSDLSPQRVKVKTNGLTTFTVMISHEGEPIRKDFFIVSANAIKINGASANGALEPVWSENLAINVRGKSSAKLFEVEFAAPLPLGNYQVTFDVDATNEVTEKDEKNNRIVQRVTVGP